MKTTLTILISLALLISTSSFANNEKTLVKEKSINSSEQSINSSVEKETLIIVKNILGETMYSKVEIEEHAVILVVNKEIKELPKGIYLIIATSNNKIYKKKIMIK